MTRKEEENVGKTLHKQVLPYLNKIREKWLNKRVILLTGKFKGREATTYHLAYQLTAIHGNVAAFVRIWKLRDPTEFVFSHPDDLRSYDIDTELELIEES